MSSSEESASRIIGNWRVSRRLEKKGAIDKVGCVSLKSDLTWRDMVQKKSFLNLHDIFGPADGLVYAGTHVQVEKKGTWIFRIGHDGGMRLFVDGKPVIADPRLQNPLIATRTSVSVTLDEGIHEIVIAFDLAAGMGWGIVLSFVAETSGNRGHTLAIDF